MEGFLRHCCTHGSIQANLVKPDKEKRGTGCHLTAKAKTRRDTRLPPPATYLPLTFFPPFLPPIFLPPAVPFSCSSFLLPFLPPAVPFSCCSFLLMPSFSSSYSLPSLPTFVRRYFRPSSLICLVHHPDPFCKPSFPVFPFYSFPSRLPFSLASCFLFRLY